jgi:hypothetical protein
VRLALPFGTGDWEGRGGHCVMSVSSPFSVVMLRVCYPGRAYAVLSSPFQPRLPTPPTPRHHMHT